jgi:hypothetical protein
LGAATKRLGALSEETHVERPRLPSPRTPACLNSEASNAHNHTVVSVRAGGARDFVSQTKRRETTHGAGLPVRETFTMMCRVSKRMRKGGEAWSAQHHHVARLVLLSWSLSASFSGKPFPPACSRQSQLFYSGPSCRPWRRSSLSRAPRAGPSVDVKLMIVLPK